MTAPAMDVLGPGSRAPHCQKHPRAPAGWHCPRCDAALCPECVVGRRVQTVELVACGRCGDVAQTILAHRRRVPLARRLKKAWRYVLTPSGAQVLMAVSLVLSVLGVLTEMAILATKLLPLALYGSVFWATFYTLVRNTARGDMELDTAEFTDIFRDGILPGLRGLASFVLVWTPAILYVFLRPGGEAGEETGRFASVLLSLFSGSVLGDPVFWVLLLLGVVWLPMSLMQTGAGQPPWSILNPLASLRMAKQLGGDYLLTAGVLAGLGVLHLVAHGVALMVRSLDLFIISRVLGEALTLVVPFTAAHVVGLLLYVRGDTLGYGVAQDYLEPILGDAQPRVAAPSMLDEALIPRGPVPAALAAPEPVVAGPSHTEQLSALSTAVESRDVPQAMALYASLGQLPGVVVPPAHHLFIGQAAAVEGNFPLAVQALERAADVAPEDPTAPRALVLLARVLGERMHDVARAEEVYRYVLHRYPDTSAARYARERVAPVSD